MSINLLLVSTTEFPENISIIFEEKGFTSYFGRGCLKVKKNLEVQDIQLIIWHYFGYKESLAVDLIKIFNKNATIPLIIIAENTESIDIGVEIQNQHIYLDQNDAVNDLSDFLEKFSSNEKVDDRDINNEFHEIDFKNALSQIISENGKNKTNENRNTNNQISFLTPWTAVDKVEKDIISGLNVEEPAPIIKKVKGWLGKR